MDLGRPVGNPPLDRLAVGEPFAECHSLARMFAKHLERAPRQAHAPQAHLEPARGQPKLHRAEAVAHLAQDLPLM